jgi:hypothetical protein
MKYIYIRKDGTIISNPQIKKEKHRWDDEGGVGGVATQVSYVGDIVAKGNLFLTWGSFCECCATREEDLDVVRYNYGKIECLRIPFPSAKGDVYSPVWQMITTFSATQITKGFIAQFDGMHFYIRTFTGNILYSVPLPQGYRGEEAAKQSFPNAYGGRIIEI